MSVQPQHTQSKTERGRRKLWWVCVQCAILNGEILLQNQEAGLQHVLPLTTYSSWKKQLSMCFSERNISCPCKWSVFILAFNLIASKKKTPKNGRPMRVGRLLDFQLLHAALYKSIDSIKQCVPNIYSINQRSPCLLYSAENPHRLTRGCYGDWRKCISMLLKKVLSMCSNQQVWKRNVLVRLTSLHHAHSRSFSPQGQADSVHYWVILNDLPQEHFGCLLFQYGRSYV